MKKLFFILSLLPLWGAGGFAGLFAAPISVSVVPITANYVASPPTVTFQLSWPAGSRGTDNRSDVWVFVEYKKVLNNAYAGSWTRAGIAGAANITSLQTASASYVTGNNSGFFVQGPATGDFAATVTVPLTVDLTGHASQFGWCAYAIDRPPHAEATNSGYILHGTPPFTITTTGNGATVTETTYAYNNTCIYGLTDATGCPGDPLPFIPPEITGFTASASSICAGQSVTLTATTTGDAASYSFNNGYSWQASSTTVRTPENSFTYTLLVMPSPGACTVSASTTHPVTVRPLPELVVDYPTAGMCPHSEATLTVDGAGNAGSYCFTYECTACLNNPYLTGNDEPAASDCAWYSECIYSEANTYTVAMYDAGSLAVRVRAMTEYGCVDSLDITIGKAPSTITLKTGNSSQTVTRGTAIEDIRYEIPCASGASVTGLPAGVTGVWNANTFTISGTPTAAGASTYTVTTAYADGSPDAAATGRITVTVPPPPGAGTTTWPFCSQVWSDVLRNDVAGCVKYPELPGANNAQYVESDAYYGYFYNWFCVTATKNSMCPSPWRVPTRADGIVLSSCKTSSELAVAWGIIGWMTNGAGPDNSRGCFWLADGPDPCCGYMYGYNPGFAQSYSDWGGHYATQIRCVRNP